MRAFIERPDLRMVRTQMFCERCGTGYTEDRIEECTALSTWRTACLCTEGSGRCELASRDTDPASPGRKQL